NSPFVEPSRHFAFTEQGIPDTILEGRRRSAYPIPRQEPGKPAARRVREEQREIPLVNHLRAAVARFRQGGYPRTERRTRRLPEQWRREDRDRRLFFCQLEAVETAIYLLEAAPRLGDHEARALLEAAQSGGSPRLLRLAFKMATGSGKTVVMAMLIA